MIEQLCETVSKTTSQGWAIPPQREKSKDMLVHNGENSVAARVVPNVKPVKRRPSLSTRKDTLRTQIELIREAREMAAKDHARVVQEKEQRIRLLQTRISTVRKDFYKHVPIHMYAAELKVQEVPSYIIILQAKLCREVHRMCAEDNQLTFCKNTVRSLGKFCLKQVREMEQEKSQLEVEVLNGMARLEVQQKELQEDYNEKVYQQRLQVVDIQRNFTEERRAGEDSGIDSIMNRLSILNTNLKRQTEPQDEEITLDDLQADRIKSSSLDVMLGEKKTAWHGSWSGADDETQDRTKGVKRRGSMFATKTWRSEKHEVGWR
jgi:hypothetical protein